MKGFFGGVRGSQDVKHLSADFMADPVSGRKRRKVSRVSLHYEDGKMVLTGGEDGELEGGGEQRGAEEEEGESEEEEGESEEEEEGESEEEEEGESEEGEGGEAEVESEEGGEAEEESQEEGEDASECGYASDLDISEEEEEEEEEDEGNMDDEEESTKLMKTASEELPYTLTGMHVSLCFILLPFTSLLAWLRV